MCYFYRALKRGVKLGLLQAEQGRYRLNDISRLARPFKAREIRGRQRLRQRQRPLKIFCDRTPYCS